KRRAHQQRRRQEADRAEQTTQEDAAHSVNGDLEVQTAGVWEPPQDKQPEHRDGSLEHRVHAKRMLSPRDVLREKEAADAHAAHERAEEYAERYGGRADDETEQLEPDDLVNQRRAATADEQQDEQGQEPVFDRRRRRNRRRAGVRLSSAGGF